MRSLGNLGRSENDAIFFFDARSCSLKKVREKYKYFWILLMEVKQYVPILFKIFFFFFNADRPIHQKCSNKWNDQEFKVAQKNLFFIEVCMI